MSWIDASRGGADEKVRRVFYLRNTSETRNDFTTRLRDQLPQNYVLRVQAQAALAGVTTTLTSTTLIELRLYNAFTTERIWDSGETGNGGFLVLGYFTPIMGAGAATAGSYVWTAAPPIETRSTGNGNWRVVLFDVSTNAAVLTTIAGALTMAVDVRAGGPIVYTT